VVPMVKRKGKWLMK